MRNGMMALNQAVGNVEDSFDPMQKADSTTTILLASCVMDLEKGWNKILEKDRDKEIKDSLLDPENSKKSVLMQADATKYLEDSTKQDNEVRTFQGAMDVEKGQTGQDSDNYKNCVAFEEGVIGISATTTNLISKHY